MIGYSYFTFSNINWRSLPYGLSLISPPRITKDFTCDNAKTILSKSSAFYIRWESNFDKKEQSCWWHIIKEAKSGTDLYSYSSKTRNQVRRGLKNFYCLIVPKEFIINNCYPIYLSSYSRYRTFEPIMTTAEFKKPISNLPSCTEFWIVHDKANDSLVGFSENYLEQNTCFYNSMWFDPNALKNYCSYSLIHEMNKHYLDQLNFDYVSDGARSLSHSTNIHDFLVSKFNFRKSYAQLNVEYVYWLRLLIILIYPFRNLLKLLPSRLTFKLSILLQMEHLRRLSNLK